MLASSQHGSDSSEGESIFGSLGLPAFIDPMIMEEIFHFWNKRRFPIPFQGAFFPFSSSRRTLHDLHDVIRAWTSLRLGELVYAFDQRQDVEADQFASTVLRSIGFGERLDLGDESSEGEFNSPATVMVAHLDIGEG
jgi:hypothetical protein